jgi:apolipoprotein N-acyltransferase
MAAASGLGLALSFPPLGFWPLVFVAFWPLLAALGDAGAGRRLVLGCVAGLVWAECTVLPWLYPAARSHLAAGPFSALVLAGGAAWLYGGLYLAAFALVYPWLPRPRWLTAPAVWVLGEALRGEALGGAAWAFLGHSFHAWLPLAQLAELTGVAGLSFLALMPAAALAEPDPARRRGLIVWGLALMAALAFGLQRLGTASSPPGGTSIVVVGGQNATRDPLAAYVEATRAAPPADVTVWPESALPGYLQEEAPAAAAVRETARARGWLLFGSRRYEGRETERRHFNAAFLVDPSGRLRDAYDKIRLVPFAERSPWPFPSVVARPYTAGTIRPPLAAGPLRLGLLVCWESIFAEPARGHARAGVDVLVNLTSDRDLGAGATQQLAFSRFRAIEARRWLVRASGLGPTHMIDPLGRVHQQSELRVPVPGPPTFYVRHGEVAAWGAAAVLVVTVVLRTVRRARVRTAGRGRS